MCWTVQAVAHRIRTVYVHQKDICPLRVLPEGLSNHSPLRPPSDGMGRRETHSRCILRRRRRPPPQLGRKVGRTVQYGPHVASRARFCGKQRPKIATSRVECSRTVQNSSDHPLHSPRATLLRQSGAAVFRCSSPPPFPTCGRSPSLLLFLLRFALRAIWTTVGGREKRERRLFD